MIFCNLEFSRVLEENEEERGNATEALMLTYSVPSSVSVRLFNFFGPFDYLFLKSLTECCAPSKEN